MSARDKRGSSNVARFVTCASLVAVVSAILAYLTAAFVTWQASPAFWPTETRLAVAIGWLIFGGASSIAAGATAMPDVDPRWRY